MLTSSSLASRALTFNKLSPFEIFNIKLLTIVGPTWATIFRQPLPDFAAVNIIRTCSGRHGSRDHASRKSSQVVTISIQVSKAPRKWGECKNVLIFGRPRSSQATRDRVILISDSYTLRPEERLVVLLEVLLNLNIKEIYGGFFASCGFTLSVVLRPSIRCWLPISNQIYMTLGYP